MAKQNPLAQVKDRFGSKEKLVDAIVKLKLLDNADGDLEGRLLARSNKKLLALEANGAELKEAGGKSKAAQEIADLRGQGKDKDYVAKLESYPVGRLMDALRSAQKAAKKKAKN